MDYNQFCQNLVSEVDDALAVALVDVESVSLMGSYHTISYFTDVFLDAIAVAAVDMFRGKNITRIENFIAQQKGVLENVPRTMEEIQMTTTKTYHFMKIIPEKDILVILITQKDISLGMGWAAIRRSIEQLN